MINWIDKPTYDKRTGLSKGSIGTQYGLVEASAKISTDDYQDGLASNFIGCSLVERRCRKEEARRKMNVMLDRYRGAKTVYEQLAENVGLYQSARMAANIMRNYRAAYEKARVEYYKLKDGERDYIKRVLDEKKSLNETEARILSAHSE